MPEPGAAAPTEIKDMMDYSMKGVDKAVAETIATAWPGVNCVQVQLLCCRMCRQL